jgi:hypothetical protein
MLIPIYCFLLYKNKQVESQINEVKNLTHHSDLPDDDPLQYPPIKA